MKYTEEQVTEKVKALYPKSVNWPAIVQFLMKYGAELLALFMTVPVVPTTEQQAALAQLEVLAMFKSGKRPKCGPIMDAFITEVGTQFGTFLKSESGPIIDVMVLWTETLISRITP